MPRTDLWKSLLVAGAVLLSLWTLWPSFQFYQLPREERISAPKDTPTARLREKAIPLGLDLQGGMHLVLEVNTEKVVESSIERNFQEIRELARRNQIQNAIVERPSPLKISIQVQGQENIDKI